MNALAIQTAQPMQQAQAITPALFTGFIEYIDRGEATTRAYTKNLRQFAAWLKYSDTSSPARADIILYRQWLLTEHDAIQLDRDSVNGWKYRTDRAGDPAKVNCKPNTVQLYLRSVCQFFKWTASAGLYPNIAENVHAPKVDHSTHKKDALTPAQVLTIEQSIAAEAEARTEAQADKEKDTAGRVQRSTEQGKRLFSMYLLAVNAGLRTIELHRANIKDIEVKDGQAIIYIWGKGHTEPDQRIPLAPEVHAAITDYLQARTDNPTGTSPLFVSTGNRSRGKRIATTTISKMLKGAMQAAGYNSERLTAHSLRHSAGNAVQNYITGDIYETQKFMRHTDPKTTEIYIHEGPDEQKKAAGIAQQLYNLYHGTKQDERTQLEQTLNKLTPEQLKQIEGIVAAMA